MLLRRRLLLLLLHGLRPLVLDVLQILEAGGPQR